MERTNRSIQALLLASLLMLCSGCDWLGLTGSDGDDVPVIVDSTEPFELALGQSAAIREFGLTILFEDVEDSRCPIEAMCIWSGEVQASFRLKHARESYSVLVRGYVGGEVQREGLSKDVGRYRVEVLAVAPYPSILTKTFSRPKATLVVRIKK